MDDNRRDADMMRNQMIALAVMALGFVIFFQYFAPPPPVGPDQVTPPEESTPLDLTDLEAPDQSISTPAPAPPPPEPLPQPTGAWPYLPPVATDSNSDELITLENNRLRLVFTRIGGRLKEASVLLGNNHKNDVQLVPDPNADLEEGVTPLVTDADAAYPLGLYFTEEALKGELNKRRFDAQVDAANNRVVFTLAAPGALEVTKTFTLPPDSYVLDAAVTLRSLEAERRRYGVDATPAYNFAWGPNITSGDRKKGIRQTLVWRRDNANDTEATAKFEPGDDGRAFTKQIQGPDWLAVKSAYFVVALKPEDEATGPYLPQGYVIGLPDQFYFGLRSPSFALDPNQAQTNRFRVYIGPSQGDLLAAAWPTLETSLRFFEWFDVMDRFAKFLLGSLNWFHNNLHINYGWAIILLTLIVRIVMYPLTLKSMKSMKRMSLLAPEIEELKAKYGDDAQEMQRKMMELYRERGINPVGGCLPMLLQMPVFIALYRMLWSAFELRGAPFMLWIDDLSEADQLLRIPGVENIPFIGQHIMYLNVLPILMTLAMVVSTKIMPVSGPAQNPQQKMIMTVMPIFMGVIFYNYAAGLNLYILTSTVLGMAQTRLTHISEKDAKELPKKAPKKKRQHFYTAAQARKRAAKKEAKQGSKRKPTGARREKPGNR
jgi:YidC/Oxa1 family membrane protein insertase